MIACPPVGTDRNGAPPRTAGPRLVFKSGASPGMLGGPMGQEAPRQTTPPRVHRMEAYMKALIRTRIERIPAPWPVLIEDAYRYVRYSRIRRERRVQRRILRRLG